jgi:hypothetical protein
MNERIQELLIEAHKQTNGGIYNGHLSEWTEKFAELIIKECLRIADSRGAYQVMDDIIERFGVEL